MPAGIKEITANFGLDPELPFVANVDDLLIEEEALNNPGAPGDDMRRACMAGGSMCQMRLRLGHQVHVDAVPQAAACAVLVALHNSRVVRRRVSTAVVCCAACRRQGAVANEGQGAPHPPGMLQQEPTGGRRAALAESSWLRLDTQPCKHAPLSPVMKLLESMAAIRLLLHETGLLQGCMAALSRLCRRCLRRC